MAARERWALLWMIVGPAVGGAMSQGADPTVLVACGGECARVDDLLLVARDGR
jgi:hypothetical protein